MDPLTITTSIVGLLTAAGKLSETLTTITSSLKEAPRLASSVLFEVNDVRRTLVVLESFLLGLASTTTSRAAMIQLDHLLVTFTESVLIFSELKTLIPSITAPGSSNLTLQSRIKWARKEETILHIIQRLQWNKASLGLILNIMQWHILRHSLYP